MQVIIKRNNDGEVSMINEDQRTEVIAVMSHGQFKKKFGFRLSKGSEGLYQMSLKAVERRLGDTKK